MEENSKPIIENVQNPYISFNALGKDIEQQQVFTSHIDEGTGNFIYHDSFMRQGEHVSAATMKVIGDSIYINDTNSE